jgi:glycosyltransferase involved in cell wall biosynthesis
MDITILFPVLNEKLRLEKGIVTTVEYLRKNFNVPCKLMILDNGSTDETPEIAKELCEMYEEVAYVRVEERGVGVAFREGIKRNTSDIVGYMDIDLSTNIKHLGEAIRIFENREDIEYINGTRFSRQSDTQGRKWYRKITSKGLLILLKSILKMKSTDAVCGFTFMRKKVADELIEVSGNENGWFYTVEMLLRAERGGVRIMDMPVEWQEDYNTTVKLWKTIRNYLMQIKRLRREFKEEDKANAKKS